MQGTHVVPQILVIIGNIRDETCQTFHGHIGSSRTSIHVVVILQSPKDSLGRRVAARGRSQEFPMNGHQKSFFNEIRFTNSFQ